MRKKSLCLCLLALCLLLCACGGAKVEPVVVDGNEYRPEKTTEITAVVTEEKHAFAQRSVVSRPSGWLTAQYGNTLVTPSV